MRATAKSTFWGKDSLLGAILTTRENPHTAIAQLKSKRSYRQAKRIIKNLRPFRLKQEDLYGNRVSETWGGVLKSPRHRDRNRDNGASTDWVQEFGWLSHGFQAYAHEINVFLNQRRLFGAAYLLGDYVRAQEILDEVEKEHGLSFWLAERRLMVSEVSGGFETHKALLAEMQSQIPTPLTRYIITRLSYRLETHVNHEIFQSSTSSMLRDLNADDRKLAASLIEIQTSPWTHEWASQGQEMLRWCTGRPLVDRYDRAIKILAYMSLDKLTEDQRSELALILRDLQLVIDDRQLAHVQRVALDVEAELTLDSYSEQYLSALDDFVAGRFKASAESAEDLLKKDPTSFSLYWLLVRAVACSPEHQPVDIQETSLAAQILKNIQVVAENRVDISVPLLALFTLSIKLGDNHIGMSLWQFAERESTGAISRGACRHAAIQSKVLSPEPTLGNDRKYQQFCLKSLGRSHPASPSVQLETYRSNRNSPETVLPGELSEVLTHLALAEKASQRDETTEVLHHVDVILRGSLSGTNEARFHAASAVALEFDALIDSDMPEEAAAAVLEHYVTNSNLLRHMPFEHLIEGAHEEKWPDLRGQVYWPILVFLNNGDEQDIYEAVDDFLSSCGCESPVQILEEKVPCPDGALRILLRDVLILRVLARGYKWGRTHEEQRKLRTEILRKLYSISVEDQAFVVNELSELDQARVLEEAYKNVEGPKFFLDFGDLNKSMIALIEDSYDRYLSFKSYEEKGGQLTDEAELLELVKSGDILRSVENKKGANSEFIQQTLATYVFGQYLFHPVLGMNATLRTRIIHGALENQLKRVPCAHALLATLQSDGSYKCDKSVIAKINDCTPKDQKVIEGAYIDFTKSITLIYESLVSTKLRIQVPDGISSFIEQPGFVVRDLVSDQGLIDFSGLFQESNFARLHAAQLPTSSSFVTELHNTFVAQSQDTFRSVQQYIEAQLLQQVSAALDSLEAAIVTALEDSPLRALLRAEVLAAKDEFAHDLGIIRNWFSAATYQNTGIRSLSEIMVTVGSVVDRASNNRLGPLVKGLCSDEIDEVLDPHVGVALYEVLSILLRNVVQHSGFETGQRVKYRFEVSDSGSRILTLINYVISEEKCIHAIEEAQKSLSKPGDPRVLDRSPGGTGLGRIRALLAPHSAKQVDLQVQQGDSATQFMIKVTY